jgi:predicted Zn finger-like uncharacterized protein
MLIVCPNCKKRFDIDPGTLGEAKKLRCSSCKAVFRLVRKAAGEAPPPPAAAAPISAAAAPLRAPTAGPLDTAAGAVKVVVANESAAFCEAVRKVLATEPFEIFACNDGKVALETVQQVRPQLLLLDVALPTMFGFEVCERVRQDPELSGVRIVLIASIYDKTRYKRSPNSLYGADDYIEKHHIPDALIPMLYRLAGGAPAATAASASDLAAQEEVRSEIRDVEERETSAAQPADPFSALEQAGVLTELTAPAAAPVQSAAARGAANPPATTPAAEEAPAPAVQLPVELSEPETKARRLARIIVSDIVLYNQGKVEQGVREGNFYDLLADDIREGERLYRQRVSDLVRESTTFLQDAFDDLIAKKRAELRM